MSSSKRRKTEVVAALVLSGPVNKEEKPAEIVIRSLANILDSSLRDADIEIELNRLKNVVQFDESIRDRARKAAAILQETIVKLQAAIDAATIISLQHVNQVTSTAQEVRELVGYAHKLSLTTSAPPGHIPGQTPLLYFKPPAPEDVQLRASALFPFYKEYNVLKKAGQQNTVYKAPDQADKAKGEGLIENVAIESKQTDVKTSTTTPSLADILSKLPPMPPGWKPGDPIPGLPPGTDVVPVADQRTELKASEPQAPAPPSQKLEKRENIPIVRPALAPVATAFDFALNPDLEMIFDQDDYESDEDSEDSD